MSDHNKFLTYKRNILQQADSLRFPASVLFELTSRCNFHCSMCYVHNTEQEKEQCELNTAQWLDIFDSAVANGLMFATLSGGECLLRPDFKELYLSLYNRGVSVRINSNGSLISDEMISFFKRYPPEDIQISLYGTSEEEYKAATKTTQYFSVIHAVESLKNADIHVKLAITPSVESKSFITNIIKFAIDNKLAFSLSEYILTIRGENVQKKDCVLPSDICSYLKYERELRRIRSDTIPLTALPLPGHGGENIEEKTHCLAGRCLAMIDANGIMHPCVALTNISASVLKNKYSEAWKEICDSMDQLTYPEQCGTCAYKNVCKPCHAARSDNENPSECNSATCELIRLKCSAGLLKIYSESTT